MKKMLSPRTMLITAMLVFGTIGLFVRNIPVSSGELALYRAVLAALMLGLYFLVTKQKIGLKSIGRELPLLLLSGGIAYTIGAVLYGIGGKKKWMHSVFHIFVILGALLQFFAVLFYAV